MSCSCLLHYQYNWSVEKVRNQIDGLGENQSENLEKHLLEGKKLTEKWTLFLFLNKYMEYLRFHLL